MAINCWLIVINQTFPPGAYIFHTQRHLPYLRDTSHSFPFQSRCSLSIPVPNLCAHRARESRPPEPDALHRDTCSGVRAIRFLGTVFRDCSPATSSSSTSADQDRLLRLRLLPGGRSRGSIDYFVFFLVDVRGTALRTSSCIDCGPLLHATHYVD